MKKKICVVVASRANYGRVKSVMRAVQESPDLELQLIVGASTLLERFGRAIDVIKADGFTPLRSIYYVVEGETLSTQAKSTGMGIVELTTAFEDLKPDMVVTVADRFETMATAVAATYLNIPLVHLQGGEVSGNIDDRVRHAITKLADVHFVASEMSAERVISMGENPRYVFNYGCPAIDLLCDIDLSLDPRDMKKYQGVGKPVDWSKPYILMLQHPVTTAYGHGFEQVSETLEALKLVKDIQKIVMWPNIDAGSDHVSKGIRHFRENNMDAPIFYFKNFPPEDYARVLNNAVCCVGNSSSFIREGSFLGAPVVLVGDRQQGREHGNNIAFSNYERNQISDLIMKQLEHGRYKSDKRFGVGKAGSRIAEELTKLIL
ncbi:UDP-N-acetylglucosamine 2-epimerase (hydrolyzing) [Hahella sp. KA22]|uniref:UDP-N-acetylglucosamine 2-epimerase n=1 Tax=Hahella sp. KA22 TaxID=1628392 RepID=UPI000FDE2309|nr:UDP-N-acetylglucosamine 2-epimerase [Hahella sp. KA22]AZZ91674.1 UDP-N-acetylglucosamine 2-epimerase (hydrolyzing) [Hahella sp. KA22]QAY55044.1 UDP-N-acetylglucosamine 2-epimerase (hydrolyzing) [Hahella sp. KA22]